jgi:peptidoglycan/LPS O-acetylase OafA/YrhL
MFFFFVPGMLLALLRCSWERQRPRWLDGPFGRANLWLAVAVAAWVFAVEDTHRIALCAPAAFLITGACVLPLRSGRLIDALGWRPLALIGIASYSLYLWHLPIIFWLVPDTATDFWPLLGIALPLCLAAAALSYRLVESPFLRLRRRWSRPVTVSAPRRAVPAPAMS